VSIGEPKIKEIKFAEDQAVVSVSAKALREMIVKINCTAKKYRMKINAGKTKTMAITKTKIEALK